MLLQEVCERDELGPVSAMQFRERDGCPVCRAPVVREANCVLDMAVGHCISAVGALTAK